MSKFSVLVESREDGGLEITRTTGEQIEHQIVPPEEGKALTELVVVLRNPAFQPVKPSWLGLIASVLVAVATILALHALQIPFILGFIGAWTLGGWIGRRVSRFVDGAWEQRRG